MYKAERASDLVNESGYNSVSEQVGRTTGLALVIMLVGKKMRLFVTVKFFSLHITAG